MKGHFNKILTINYDKNKYCPDLVNSLNLFIKKGIPFILKGYHKEWNCNKWKSTKYLSKIFGDYKLPIEYFSKPFNEISSLSKVSMKFDEYINEILLNERPNIYLAELELFNGKSTADEIAKLNSDVKKVFYQDELAYRVFLLGKNTLTQMHYHRIYESFIHHVSGPKWTYLYPISRSLFYQLKPYPWYSKLNDWSQILFESKNYKDFENMSKNLGLKEGYKVYLEPGDSIYVPVYWWHIVFGQDITTSFVDFFHSSWRKKYMTFLGVRSMNHFNLIKRNLV